MRDIVFMALLVGSLPYTVLHPWFGIMVWNVISIMNPHQYTWTVKTWPVGQIVAIAILIGVLVTKDHRKLPLSPPTIALGFFVLWICVAYPFGIDVAGGWEKFIKIMKIQFMIFVTLAVLHERRHVDWLTWVLVISLGFYGLKGGLFTLLSGGQFRVWGPPGSFIQDNNEIALALAMTIPLMRYLQLQAQRRWIRLGFYGAMLFTALAVLGAHSRGSMLAIAAMAILLWLRSPKKLLLAPFVVLAGIGLAAFMPQEWWDRMATIETYEEDRSATGRINAWWTMFNIAKANFFGGGFAIYNPTVFGAYAPDPTAVHAAHSIYFQVLGEVGFVGLILFVTVWALTWRGAGWLYRNGAKDPSVTWARHLGGMVQASLLAYLVGGAFYSLTYFDLPYNLVVLVVVARALVENSLAAKRAQVAGSNALEGNLGQPAREAGAG